ncbi:MAG: hypothetical protein ACJ8AH_21190 [Stellaceae bacterium]
MDTAPQDNGVLPTVTDSAALPDAGTTGSGYNANGQPDIESMPLPNFMKPPLSAPPMAKLAGGGKSFERGGREGMPAAAPSSPFERQGREGMPEPAPTQSLLSQGYDTFMGGVRTLGHDVAQAGRGALDTIQSYLPTSGACRLALMRQPRRPRVLRPVSPTPMRQSRHVCSLCRQQGMQGCRDARHTLGPRRSASRSTGYRVRAAGRASLGDH